MRVLITGASGFIGRHLIEKLLEKKEIEIVAQCRSNIPKKYFENKNISWTQANIVDDNIRHLFDHIDMVFHLAANLRLDESEEAEKELRATNVVASRRLAEMAIEQGVKKFIYVSSIAASERGDKVELNEENGVPVSLYGKTKLEGEREIIRILRNKIPYLVFRPVAVFGEEHEGSVYELVKAIQNNRYILIGSGQNYVNFFYVRDLVNYIVQGALSDVSDEIFIVNHGKTTLKEFVNMIRGELGKKESSLHVPKSLGLVLGTVADVVSKVGGKGLAISRKRVNAMCRNVYYNPEKLFKNSSFSEDFGLRIGLANTINWYKSAKKL